MVYLIDPRTQGSEKGSETRREAIDWGSWEDSRD